MVSDTSQTQQNLQFCHFGLPVHVCIFNRTGFLRDILISIIANVYLIFSGVEEIAPEYPPMFVST